MSIPARGDDIQDKDEKETQVPQENKEVKDDPPEVKETPQEVKKTPREVEETPKEEEDGIEGLDIDLSEDEEEDVWGLDVDLDRELRVRDIVHSATKAVTTVQEAPWVIHVITDEDISARGYRNLQQSLLDVPGVLGSPSQKDIFPNWLIRGVTQGVLFMKDGLSLFDPTYNIIPALRRQPLETIKRIEVMTGPGGVLWGSNSFLGIINIISKDAEDVDGVEIGMGGGHGPGDEAVIRPYVMYGDQFFDNRLKVFLHGSVEWFKGPKYTIPELYLYSPPPRINGTALFRNLDGVETDVPFSMYAQLTGKVSLVKPGESRNLQLAWQLTTVRIPKIWDGGGINRPIGFVWAPIQRTAEVAAIRNNKINWHNSFVTLSFRDRFMDSRIGLDTKAYYIRFHRSMDPMVTLPASSIMPGVGYQDSGTYAERAGFSLDMDWQIHRRLRLLWGGEGYYEWLKGSSVNFIAPQDASGNFNPTALSIICPFEDHTGSGLPVYDPVNPENTTFLPGCRQPLIFDSDRFVAAGFVAARYQALDNLSFEGGVRLQAAPLGNATYDPVLLYSAAASWNFWRSWYLKGNYSTGFRSPIFNNVAGNPAIVAYSGDPDIRVERSQSVQAQINGRLFESEGLLRVWEIRANYSYTHLKDMIRILDGQYRNSPDRAINAVEFLTNVEMLGGHSLLFSYTYVRQHGSGESDGGIIRGVPNHWFAATGVFNVLAKPRWRLDLNSSIRVIGAFEDPNRYFDDSGTARASDQVYDRIASQARWHAGARLQTRLGDRRLSLALNFHNIFGGRQWGPDVFSEIASRTDFLPHPEPSFYFFAQAKVNL